MPIHNPHQRLMKREYLKYAYKTMHGQIIEFDRELSIEERSENYFVDHFPGMKRASEFDKCVDIGENDALARSGLTRDQIVVGGVYVSKKEENHAFRVKRIAGTQLSLGILWIEYKDGNIESVTTTHNEYAQYSDITFNQFVRIDDPVKTVR